MADLSPAAQKALAYWPQIDYAAQARLSTADLWASIREAAANAGYDTPGVSAAGVAALRGYAGRIQRTQAAIEKADPTTPLSGLHVAQAPWSRPLGEQAAYGMYQVRFQHTYTNAAGEEETVWRSSMFRGGLPTTVGELLSGVDEDAAQMAIKYGVDHVGVGALQVMAV